MAAASSNGISSVIVLLCTWKKSSTQEILLHGISERRAESFYGASRRFVGALLTLKRLPGWIILEEHGISGIRLSWIDGSLCTAHVGVILWIQESRLVRLCTFGGPQVGK
jgi:hypothetical protein